MYNKARYEIPPTRHFIWECGPFFQGTQEILQAWVDINGIPHRFYATHWHHGWKDREVDAPERIASAEKSLLLIKGDPSMAFYGGDLNECRPSSAADPNNLCTYGDPPTPKNAPGTAVAQLLTSVRDSLADLRSLYDEVDPATGAVSNRRISNCDTAPIDDVFYRTHKNTLFGSPYEPVEYTSNCGPENFPSDHPFVLVAFERTSPRAALEP
jgi:hypothetical protein